MSRKEKDVQESERVRKSFAMHCLVTGGESIEKLPTQDTHIVSLTLIHTFEHCSNRCPLFRIGHIEITHVKGRMCAVVDVGVLYLLEIMDKEHIVFHGFAVKEELPVFGLDQRIPLGGQ